MDRTGQKSKLPSVIRTLQHTDEGLMHRAQHLEQGKLKRKCMSIGFLSDTI